MDTNVATILAAIFSIAASGISWLNRREIQKTKATVAEVHVRLNGHIDELLRVTKALAFAAGMQEQRDIDTAAAKQPPEAM